MRRNVYGIAALAVALAWTTLSCLPDLAVTTIPYCGDGVIDPDLGETCDPGGTLVQGCSRTCQVQCTESPRARVGEDGQCYFWSGTQAGHAESEANCSFFGGSLIRPTDSSTVSELLSLLETTSSGVTWLGFEGSVSTASSSTRQGPEGGTYYLATGYDFATSGDERQIGFHDRCSGCLDAPILISERDRAGADELCLSLWAKTASVVATSCSGIGKFESPVVKSKRPIAVCQRPPAGRRSTACGKHTCFHTWSTYNRKRYVLQHQPVVRSKVDQVCAALGAEPVVIENKRELLEIWHELNLLTARVTAVWTGLYRDPVGIWVWGSEKRPATSMMSVWAEGHPPGTSDTLESGARAYLRWINRGADDLLARAETSDERTLAVLCQRPPD